MLQLPGDYAKNRVVPFAHLGTAGTHTPDGILVRHDRALILIHMTTDTYLIKTIHTNGDETLEAANRPRGDPTDASRRPDLPGTDAEMELNPALSRLALAACLLLLVYGTRRVGPANRANADRLQRYLDRAKKSRDPGRIAAANCGGRAARRAAART